MAMVGTFCTLPIIFLFVRSLLQQSATNRGGDLECQASERRKATAVHGKKRTFKRSKAVVQQRVDVDRLIGLALASNS
jgi:hypothetical protein